jgi:hypothetical protein
MIKVCSNVKSTDTGIDLIQNCEYKYAATGLWVDCFIPCNADGYLDALNFSMDTIFGQNTKRRVSAKWFQLVGEIKGDQDIVHEINLGVEGTFPSPASGRLYVFANDVDFAYWNNFGCVELHIELNK